MAKGRKTGGRIKGQSFNLNLRSARNRMRRTFLRALPQLQRWLASDETWKSDGAAAARIVAQLGEWSAPRFKPSDAAAEAAQATTEPAEQHLPPVTPESIIAAFRSARTVKPIAAPAQPPASVPEPLPATPRLTQQESVRLRHAGVPIEGSTARLLPAEPKRAPREHHADPKLPEPAIDAEPVIDYRVPTGSLRSVDAACDFIDRHESDFMRANAHAGELPASLQRPRRGR